MRKLLMLTVLLAGVFTILPAQKVTILSPNGGETLVNGTPMLITWSYAKLSGDETLLIALEGSADFGPIAYSKVAAGSLEWLAGKKMDGSFAKPAGGYKIIIELVNNDMTFDLSDQPFSIAAPVSVVALMTPNGGETLEKGKDFDIRWSCAGQAGFVTLSLFKDELPLGTIAENLPAAGLTYRWNIGLPLLNGVNYLAGVQLPRPDRLACPGNPGHARNAESRFPAARRLPSCRKTAIAATIHSRSWASRPATGRKALNEKEE